MCIRDRYIQEQIKLQQQQPGNGLIAELIRAEAAGERLSREEMESTILLLLLAGHETTVHLISVSMLYLLQFPRHRERMLESDENANKTVVELLRHSSVVQYGKPRFVTRDMIFHGVELKRVESIMPCVAAANCDPEMFSHPHPVSYTHLTLPTICSV